MTSNNITAVEHLYSPSKWCRRYSTSDECIEQHVKKITEESIVARQGIPGNLDVPYGRLEKEKYDLFGTDLSDDAPILFYVHGGYWQEESIKRINSSFVARVFHKHGIKSFVTGYELCPDVELDVIVQEIENSLKVCLEYAKTKRSSGIFLMGHSAGAHLIAYLFTGLTKTLPTEDLQLLKTAFLVGGVYDLEPLLWTSYNIPLKLTPVTAKKLSPMEQDISECTTDFVVVVGKDDSPAFVTQSELFEKKLNTHKANSKLVILENIDHFDIIEKLIEEEFQLTEMILRSVKEKC